jgi:hypothetical protein
MASVIPQQDLLKNLKRLTESNRHGEVCFAIASWCYDNCEYQNVRTDEWMHELAPYGHYRNVFRMYMGMFASMEQCARQNGDFGYCELRYETMKSMERDIAECFGKETLDALDKAR